MISRTLIVLTASALFTAGVVVAGQSPRKPRPGIDVPAAIETEIQSALDAYATGDDLAPGRWVKGLKSTATLAYVEPVILKSPVWSRSNAAFMLEVALAAANQSRTPSLIAAGRSIVMSRPAPLGADPVEDRFEVLWHQSAIALVQASPQFFDQQDYLDAIGPRFEEAERRGVVLETRLPLARAISAGILCCWKRLPGEAAQPIPALSRGVTLDKAVALFAMAAEVPVLRREALLRGARLLYENGRYADALAWFERMVSQPEPAHGYVHHLTLGRVFDALNRPADAAAAYGAALSYVPDGQLAGIGRAAALLRSGRAEEAEAAAVAARRMPAGRRDFDRLRAFNLADLRFVPAWFIEIRKLRR